MFDQWIQFEGTLKYGSGNRLVVDISPEMARFYRSFIPKCVKFNPPKYYPHIIVVRGKYETPPNKHLWGKYQGQKVKFEYSPYIMIDRVYIWLSVRSEEIKAVRRELGLNDCFDRFKGYHITIANRKNV